MSKPRPIHPGATYLITRRIERRHCLLRPDPEMTRFILYAFIVSAHRHGIQLHAFCAMSTHLHYVVSDPQGRLPRFFEMFHQLVARGIKILRKWDGSPWDRAQTSVVELCTRQAIVEKIAYTLANPVEVGLVRHAHEWPGAKTNVDDIGKGSIQAQRPDVCFSPKNPEWKFETNFEVTLPPPISEADAQAFREDITAELAKLEAAAHARIPARRVLGAKRAARVPPEKRITTPEPLRQRIPTFAVGRGNAEAARIAARAVRAFRAAYRKAFQAWRAGDRSVPFPSGTYQMRVLHGVNVCVAG
ncbi:MAG: transposase [Polyangiaceae bacterium]|nr:transposase [Polyangiaceae bacterium]